MNLTPDQSALLDRIVTRAQAWIIEDVRIGHVPREVPGFSALHDYRDANCYTLDPEGNFDPEVSALAVKLPNGDTDSDAMWALLNKAQERLDAWVKTGALRDVALAPDALETLAREAEERKARDGAFWASVEARGLG